MLQKFITYYQNNLFEKTDNVLLAVSGGVDSMVMLHLFNSNNLNFGVAHCNFNLRAEESDADEELVKTVCKKLNIPFYSVAFNTQNYAQEKGISIQMAARELRYDWFQEIAEKNDYQFIATAHHKNDIAETLLINIAKGTGLNGLHGIAFKRNNIIRPLLNFSREEIEEFASTQNIEFRTDSSNHEIKYTRNKIRHQVIPELEKVNPKAVDAMVTLTHRIQSLETILEKEFKRAWEKCAVVDKNLIKIKIDELNRLDELPTYLFYFLKKYDFNESDVNDILHSLNEHSGLVFYSKTHQLVKDRAYLLLTELLESKEAELVVNSLDEFSKIAFLEKYEKVSPSLLSINKKPCYAYFAIDKLSFPITFRKWQSGDKFSPFGMKGQKKVSDYLIDQKVSIIEKENTWVMVSNNKICWLVGHRIDNAFRVDESTKEVLVLKTAE